MKARIPTWIVMALAALAAASAQDMPLVQEGEYWVRNGRTPVPLTLGPQVRRLRIITRGQVGLHGVPGNQVTLTLRQRVKARSAAEAERMMGDFRTPLLPFGDLVQLTVMPTARMNVATELQLFVPSQVSVTVTNQFGGIEVPDFGGTLQVTTGGGPIRLGRIGGAVQCASAGGSVTVERAGGGINCSTAGGNIVVGEAEGLVLLSTEGGNIRVDKAAGEVRAHATEGVIEVGQAGGAVVADTRGGFIQIGSARGVRAESAAGMIRVKNGSGPLNMATAAGGILAELLAGTRMQNSSLVAGSGDITVLIPSNLAVSVMARNSTGNMARIFSDFPEIRVTSAGFFRSPVTAQGAINGGGPVLDLTAASGVIYLRRK